MNLQEKFDETWNKMKSYPVRDLLENNLKLNMGNHNTVYKDMLIAGLLAKVSELEARLDKLTSKKDKK